MSDDPHANPLAFQERVQRVQEQAQRASERYRDDHARYHPECPEGRCLSAERSERD